MACIMEMLGMVPQWMVRDGSKQKRFFADDGTPLMSQNTAKGTTRRYITDGSKSRLRNQRLGPSLWGWSVCLVAFSPCRLNGTTLQGALRSEDQGFVGFLESTLRLDPNQRVTAEQATQHDWMAAQPHRPQVRCHDHITSQSRKRNLGDVDLSFQKHGAEQGQKHG